jgi:hypothetical protein
MDDFYKTLINSAAYEDIADFKILFKEDFKNLIKTGQLLQKNSIIYCKTDFTIMLFEYLKFSGRKYVLITHHSDYSIDQQWFNLKPPCIKKWYAINTAYKHPDLITIPAGIWTSEGRAYYQDYHKIKWFKENKERLFNKEKSISRVYCNWGDTNPERKNVIKKLKVPYLHQSGLSFKTYCEQMSEYKFVISPNGNGLDNHRTWEALYLGCIPIVINHYIYDGYPDLPIIRVNDYSELTQKMLNESLEKTYTYNKMYSEYWEKTIKEEFNKL